jgi:hypothetical protein
MLYIFNGRGNREEEKIGKILPIGYTPCLFQLEIKYFKSTLRQIFQLIRI